MENIRYNYCPICNERIPSIILVKGEYHYYYMKKVFIKKFLAENNMDLKDVSEELQRLIEIEEMLIV